MNKLRFFAMALLTASAIGSRAQVTPASQMEKLDRGLVAVPTSSTANFVSWRLLGTDDKAVTTFDLLRNGEVIASGLTKTNFQDNSGSAAAKYQVVTRVNGTEAETSDEVMPWGKKFLT
ncbi:MAG: rhamnogalacturonan lyase, partial [Prevotella sp.]|nr:rhamnogalacturonan lyase [Prevotella sp.]